MSEEDLVAEVEEVRPYEEEKAEVVVGGFLYQNIYDMNFRDIVHVGVQASVTRSMKYGDSHGMMAYLHDLKKKQRAAEDIMRRKLMLEESKVDAKASHNPSITHKINHKYYEPSHPHA